MLFSLNLKEWDVGFYGSGFLLELVLVWGVESGWSPS